MHIHVQFLCGRVFLLPWALAKATTRFQGRSRFCFVRNCQYTLPVALSFCTTPIVCGVCGLPVRGVINVLDFGHSDSI